MITIEPTVQFIMDELRSPTNTVSGMVDNQIFAGKNRLPISFVSPHLTRIGVDVSSETDEGYFFTTTRDFDCNNIKIKIIVLSANGEDNNYCDSVVNAIISLFSVHRKKITSEYRIFIDSMSTSVEEDNSEHWTGNIELAIKQYTPITVIN